MTISHSSTSEDLEVADFSYSEWREGFLTIVLRGACVVGLFVAIAASLGVPAFLAALYIASYVAVLVLTFARFSYRIRAIGFLLVMYVIAVSNLLETGIRVDARLFFMAMTVMATMLFGTRSGLITIGIGIGTIAVAGFFILTGRYTIISTTLQVGTLSHWITYSLVLVMLEIILVIGLARLQRGFNDALHQAQVLYGTVRTERATLERRVEARTAYLRASAELGRTVTSILEPEQLLKQVAELITERFGFYYTAVFMLDDEGQQAVLRAATGEAGQTLLERRHHLPVDEQSMVGGAIVTRSARIALDVGQGAVRFANPLLPDTRSEIALPLRAGDRVLGALDVQSKEPGVFDEASADALQTMADQIAVALLNAETFNRFERQARTMAVLNQLSRELVTATSLEDIAMTVQPAVTSLLGQSRLAIVQKTVNPQILALREFTPDHDQPVGPAQSVPAVGSLIGECIEHGEMIYASDLSQYVNRYSDVASFYQQGQRSSVIVPLRVGERILGTLNVSVDRVEAYTEAQVNQLEQIASQLATTIENLNLAEQTQQTLAELDAANRRLVGQAWGEYTQSTKLEDAEWRNGTWRVLEDGAAQPEASQALVPAAPPLSLPIKVRGTTIGEFTIASADARQVWDTEDMTFAQALVDQVGQVLETARLLDETERSAQREKAVADAADKIHRSTDIEAVLQSAVTELQRITGRRGISVQLGFGRATPVGNRAPDGDSRGDR